MLVLMPEIIQNHRCVVPLYGYELKLADCFILHFFRLDLALPFQELECFLGEFPFFAKLERQSRMFFLFVGEENSLPGFGWLRKAVLAPFHGFIIIL